MCLDGLTSSSYGRGFFCPLGKERAFGAVYAFFGYIWRSEETFVTFSSNLSNLDNNPKSPKKTFRKMSQKVTKKNNINI